ncbi:MAG: hypothetical protein ACX94C_07780 [Phycisphaerales bacterium]
MASSTPREDTNAELRGRAEEFRRKYPDRKQSTEVLKYVGEATSLVVDLLSALDAAEGRVRYTDDMTVWFIDDHNMTLQGQVHSWNEEYAIIDTNEDRYTVQHEHVFTHSPTSDEVQAALSAQHPKAGEGDTDD